jgi:hypothetical protein
MSEVEAQGTIDLGMAREVRLLRARVRELEEAVSTNGIPATVLSKLDRDEAHRAYGCGFHLHVTVSMTTDEVLCQTCGESLDPLDVLRQFASKERRFVESVDEFKRERDRLRLEVADLQKQRKNLRSQIRRKGGALT